MMAERVTQAGSERVGARDGTLGGPAQVTLQLQERGGYTGVVQPIGFVEYGLLDGGHGCGIRRQRANKNAEQPVHAQRVVVRGFQQAKRQQAANRAAGAPLRAGIGQFDTGEQQRAWQWLTQGEAGCARQQLKGQRVNWLGSVEALLAEREGAANVEIVRGGRDGQVNALE